MDNLSVENTLSMGVEPPGSLRRALDSIISLLGFKFSGFMTQDLSSPGASLCSVQVSLLTVSRIIKSLLSRKDSPPCLERKSSEGPLQCFEQLKLSF